jgi:DNA-binding NarL/FixJ family response regulator
MQPFSFPEPPQRLKLGAAQRVLLVVDPQALTDRMADIVKSIHGVEFVGGFATADDAMEWTVWDRGGWHYAFVDLNLKDGGARELVQRLLSQPKPGTVVALGAHLWKEIREECRQMGVYHLLEKGDLVAFRGFLEDLVRC